MIAIGEASKRSGVSIETIRYYEREGIVPRPGRAANNRRLYTADDIGRLHLLKRLRDLGFPLAEARMMLDLSENRASDCEAVMELAKAHIANVATKIAELKKLETALKQLVSNCSRGNVDCPMLGRLRTEQD
ncbi:MerR family transcriptional regulator [Roseibium sediminicola]|uniref:Helix-turn-helix domain-containing protein n=1 Tax=Roseibium sediminicola TaxID=2933272 RepID=A0ABT0GPT2_9HYPH|nr:helix-turn-helix domain-containing protein [Roseibium sp. CAU 1639]MCK7611446.1 helix-turn-helix domain-containing protein [Roseibium sp. CAU 1639]